MRQDQPCQPPITIPYRNDGVCHYIVYHTPLGRFFKQKTAYEIMPSLVGSEMCIRDSHKVLLKDTQ